MKGVLIPKGTKFETTKKTENGNWSAGANGSTNQTIIEPLSRLHNVTTESISFLMQDEIRFYVMPKTSYGVVDLEDSKAVQGALV